MNKNIFKIAVPVLMGLMLCACSGKQGMVTSNLRVPEANASKGLYDTISDDGLKLTSYEDAEVHEEKSSNNSPVKIQDKKLIKNVNIEMESIEFDKDMDNIKEQIKNVGGYIEYSSVSGNSLKNMSEEKRANIEIRIPDKKLDEFLNLVENIGNVKFQNESITDVTLQYTDTEGHLKVLTQEQTRLIELMSKAEDMEAILQIEKRLSELRYEIESYTTQINLYDNQIAYSTVNLSVSEVKTYTTQDKDDVMTRIGTGLKSNIIFIKTLLTDSLVFIVSSLPVIFYYLHFHLDQ